jgi:ATP-dependent DNA helicase RecG
LSPAAQALLTLPSNYLDFRVVEDRLFATDTSRVFFIEPTAMAPKQGNLPGVARDGNKINVSVCNASGDIATMSLFGFDPQIMKCVTARRGFYGFAKCFDTRNGLLITHPRLVAGDEIGKIRAVYRKKGDLTDESHKEKIATALQDTVALAEIKACVLSQTGDDADALCSAIGYPYGFHALLCALHFPLSIEQATDANLMAARFSAAVVIGTVKRTGAMTQAHPVIVQDEALERVISLAQSTLALTADQTTTIREITNFLGGVLGRHLVSGDVGTGKTLAFLVPVCASLASEPSLSVAIVAPNLLIARHIFDSARALCEHSESVALLSADTCIGDAESARLVVGTQALFAKKRRYNVVVVDETHRFSVAQRSKLLAPGGKLIESTATCVPRSLALMTVGETSVSRLRICPYTKNIETLVLDGEESRGQIAEHIKKVIADGAQAALIYPLTDDSVRVISSKPSSTKRKGGIKRESEDRVTNRGAFSAFERLKITFGKRVGLIHGGLSDEEKTSLIAQLNDKALDVIVSTTVIEMGITLPSLRLMLVVNPDRLGLATLHQLRGRLARHGGNGLFVLHHEHKSSDNASKRANMLLSSSDGFELAEGDMLHRGVGDIAGEGQQAGKTSLIFVGADVSVDMLLNVANQLKNGVEHPATNNNYDG